MNEREQQKAIEDRIDRDISFGCGTGVGIIGAVAWYGLYCGLRGVRQTRREIAVVAPAT
jgi:hypothetical protein